MTYAKNKVGGELCFAKTKEMEKGLLSAQYQSVWPAERLRQSG